MSAKKGIDWSAVAHLLGVVPDREVATLLNVDPSAVRYQRVRLGLSPSRPDLRPRGIDWSTVDDLGRISDTELAARMGLATSTVRAAREARGLPSAVKPGHRRRQRKAAPPPKPPPPPRPPPKPRYSKPPRTTPVPWDDIDVLGRVPDEELAGWLGVDTATVTAERIRRGVARIPGAVLVR